MLFFSRIDYVRINQGISDRLQLHKHTKYRRGYWRLYHVLVRWKHSRCVYSATCDLIFDNKCLVDLYSRSSYRRHFNKAHFPYQTPSIPPALQSANKIICSAYPPIANCTIILPALVDLKRRHRSYTGCSSLFSCSMVI